MTGELLRLRYEVLDLIDEGPIFQLYKGRDRVMASEINVRILKPPFASESEFVKTLTEVVHQNSGLKSIGVERVLDVLEEEGTTFLVSETHGGQLLAERIYRLAPYSVPISLAFAIQFCEALVGIHNAGMTHGEVCAHNIQVGPDGKATLLLPALWTAYGSSPDAGIAALPRLAPYLAPEVSQGKMPTPASDVYAVGALLYELLAKKTPFSAENTSEMAQKHATHPVPGVRSLSPGVPVAVEELIKKALSKEPGFRYSNAKQMLTDLRFIRDALRFGKPLSWPLQAQDSPSAAVAAVGGTAAAVAAAGATVSGAAAAPMPSSAMPTADKKEPAPEKPKKKELKEQTGYTNDVPWWIAWPAYLLFLGVMITLGAWRSYLVSKPQLLQVPDVIGMPAEEARAIFEKKGIVFRESRREPSEKIVAGKVLKLSPPVGDQVRLHGVVNAVISEGSRYVKLPNLEGLTLSDARDKLDALGLDLQEPPDERRSRRIEPGHILDSRPGKGEKVERGTKIRVTVSSKTDRRSGDAVRTRATYKIAMVIPKGTPKVMVRIELSDARNQRDIHEEMHKGGDKIEIITDGFGDPVYFRVYYNNELVDQFKKSVSESLGKNEE